VRRTERDSSTTHATNTTHIEKYVWVDGPTEAAVVAPPDNPILERGCLCHEGAVCLCLFLNYVVLLPNQLATRTAPEIAFLWATWHKGRTTEKISSQPRSLSCTHLTHDNRRRFAVTRHWRRAVKSLCLQGTYYPLEFKRLRVQLLQIGHDTDSGPLREVLHLAGTPPVGVGRIQSYIDRHGLRVRVKLCCSKV